MLDSPIKKFLLVVLLIGIMTGFAQASVKGKLTIVTSYPPDTTNTLRLHLKKNILELKLKC